jgi:DNA polymerase (family 10)
LNTPRQRWRRRSPAWSTLPSPTTSVADANWWLTWLSSPKRRNPGGPSPLDSSGLKGLLTDRQHFGAALLHATGSAKHLEQLRALGEHKSLGADVSGRGPPHRRRRGKYYDALGLPFIKPEFRVGCGEIERALKGKLQKLVTDTDLHGSCTVTPSPPTAPRRSRPWRRRRGSAVSSISGGGSFEFGPLRRRTLDRWDRKAALNKSFGKGFRILKGIESDILVDGSLDYPDEVMESFDFVVASIHGSFKLDRTVQTDRIIRAISNPYTTILGHWCAVPATMTYAGNR